MVPSAEFIGNSLILLFITYFIAFAFQLYMMYLNWKQSKVNNQMQELLEEVKSIRNLLDGRSRRRSKK